MFHIRQTEQAENQEQPEQTRLGFKPVFSAESDEYDLLSNLIG